MKDFGTLEEIAVTFFFVFLEVVAIFPSLPIFIFIVGSIINLSK